MEIMTWAEIFTGVLAFVTLLGCLVGHMLRRLEFHRPPGEENDRRLELDLQEKLTEQQIKLDELKAVALSRGDALITINGSGLEPHLEDLIRILLEPSLLQMRKILESIKVRRG